MEFTEIITWFAELPGWIHILLLIVHVTIGLIVSIPVWKSFIFEGDMFWILPVGYTICAVCCWELMLLMELIDSGYIGPVRASDRRY